MRGASETKTVTIHIPFQIRKRGGRKEMVLPPGGQLQRSRITAPQNQQTTTTFADPAIASAFKAFHHRTATLRVPPCHILTYLHSWKICLGGRHWLQGLLSLRF